MCYPAEEQIYQILDGNGVLLYGDSKGAGAVAGPSLERSQPDYVVFRPESIRLVQFRETPSTALAATYGVAP